MRNSIFSRPITTFILSFFVFLGTLTSQSGECIIVIQGVSKPVDKDNIRKSANILIRGFGEFPGGAKISVFRPKGEGNNMGANPPRTEAEYDKKADLTKLIKEALCNEDCKNVVLVFEGHGAGTEGGEKPPKDKDAGGIMIGDNVILTAEDIAKIINECPKGIKIFSSHCFGEAMTNGIKKHLIDSSIIGVGIASSAWNKKSYAVGDYSEMITFFLEDYYTIIKDPNVLEKLKKEAAKLKKKNDAERKEKIKKKEALEKKIADKEKEIKDCNDAKEAKNKEIEGVRDEIKKIEDLKKALEELQKIEEEIEDLKQELNKKGVNKTQLRKDKRAKEKERTAQRKVVKDLGGKYSTSGDIEKKMDKFKKDIDALGPEKEKLEEKKNKLEGEWGKLRDRCIDLEGELDDLKDALKKIVILPERDPLMEVIIHEAFKSVKAKMKESVPKETVIPKEVAYVELPAKPRKLIAVGDVWFTFYKVIDKVHEKDGKKTNRCVIVGWVTNRSGVPLYPISSDSCKMDCSKTKFSYTDDKGKQTIEIVKGKDGKYELKANDKKETKWDYVYESQEIKLGTTGIGHVYIQFPMEGPPNIKPKSKYKSKSGSKEKEKVKIEVTDVKFTPPVLTFTYEEEGKKFKVRIEYLPHGGKKITVDNQPSYTVAQYKRSSLYNKSGLRIGELMYVSDEEQTYGLLWQEENLSFEPFTLASSNINDYIVSSLDLDSYNPPTWQSSTDQGTLRSYVSAMPELHNPSAIRLGNSVLLEWSIYVEDMTEAEQDNILGTRILKYDGNNTLLETIDLDYPVSLYKDNAAHLSSYEFHIMIAMKNTSSCGCGDTESYPYYGYSEQLDVGPKKKDFPYIPVIGGIVGGGAIVALITSSSSEPIEDLPPTAICNDMTLNLDEFGSAGLIADQIDGGSSDLEGTISISIDDSTFDCNDLGINSVLLTVTDNIDQSDVCTSRILIVDNIPPTAICTAVNLQLDDQGMATLLPEQADGGSSDNCAIEEVLLSKTSFNCEDIGTSKVILTVIDISGNSSQCEVEITISNPNELFITCESIEVELNQSGTAIVTENDLSYTIGGTCIDPVDIIFDPVNYSCSDLGAQSLTLTAQDNSGNQATCTMEVLVKDVIPPTAICQPVVGELDEAGMYSLSPEMIDNGSFDNCEFITYTVSPDNFTVDDLGENVVVLTVTDSSGNTSTCETTLTLSEGPCNLIITTQSQPSTCGQNNGSASVTISGSGNYSIVWQDGQTGNSAFNLAPGAYSIHISDLDIGCVDVVFVLIDEITDFPFITVSDKQPGDCINPSQFTLIANSPGSGPIIVSVFNGTGLVTYELIPGETVTIEAEVESIYDIHAYDQSLGEDCFHEFTFEVPFDYNVIVVELTPEGLGVLVEIFSPYPQNNPFTIFLDGQEIAQTNQNNYFIQLEMTGVYGVYVMDNFGCYSDEVFVIVQEPEKKKTPFVLRSSNELFTLNPSKLIEDIEHPIVELGEMEGLFYPLNVVGLYGSVSISPTTAFKFSQISQVFRHFSLDTDPQSVINNKIIISEINLRQNIGKYGYLNSGVGYLQNSVTESGYGTTQFLRSLEIPYGKIGIGLMLSVSPVTDFSLGSNLYIFPYKSEILIQGNTEIRFLWRGM
jgi:hypothetical protein